MKVKRKSIHTVSKNKKEYYRNNCSRSNATVSISSKSSNMCSTSHVIDHHTNDLPVFSITDEIIEQSIFDYEYYIRELTEEEDICYAVLENLTLSDLDNDTTNLSFNNINSKTANVNKEIIFEDLKTPLTNRATKQIKKFDKACSNLKWNTCFNCGRSFPDLEIKNDKCKFCIKFPDRWTKKNNMDPGIVPPELSCLTDIEAMVIAMVHPIVSVHRYKNHGQHIYNGNVINFPQHIEKYVSVLPHIPADIPHILIFHRQFDKETLKCVARPEKLKSALLWLKNNNKW